MLDVSRQFKKIIVGLRLYAPPSDGELALVVVAAIRILEGAEGSF
jgi:hypothetical protein